MPLALNNKPEELTVSQLLRVLNGMLEAEFPRVRFIAEISQISVGASGHLYFTVKDEESQISCAMWRSYVQMLSFRPKAGDKVLLEGRPSIYPKTGRFQMVINKMELAGEGLLQKRFLELKAKLEQEGFFNPARKRRLPFLPNAVGIVTSAQGAVIHDIMVRVRERLPSLPVYLIDVRVQGEGAAEEIAEAIRMFNQQACVDVIIVARGGGSLEDLWAFNEEVVVRAIFGSAIPVVSGVGHEVDITLADLVADVRAPTPTAAAEIVVPKRSDLLNAIGEFERRLFDIERWYAPLYQAVDDCAARLDMRMQAVLDTARLRTAHAESQLQLIHPQRLLANLASQLTICFEQLQSAMLTKLKDGKQLLTEIEGRLRELSPANEVERLRDQVLRMKERLDLVMQRRIESSREVCARFAATLSAVSPVRVLERGFALVQGRQGVIRSSSELKPGESVSIRFARDTAVARIEKTVALQKR